jgi:hypothetical protein
MDGSSVPHCSVSPTVAEARAPSEDVSVVVVVGSRPPKKDAPAADQVAYVERIAAVDAFVRSLPEGVRIVSGGSAGVDSRAERAAIRYRRAFDSYRPRKQRDGTWRIEVVSFTAEGEGSSLLLPEIFSWFTPAALWRNGEMVRVATVGVKAFWDGHSRGTADTIRKARAAGKLLP